MKTLFRISLISLTGMQLAFSQVCNPDTSYTVPGFYVSDSSNGCLGDTFYRYITIVLPDSIQVDNTTTLLLEKVKLNNLGGLPSGLIFDCNLSGCEIPGGTSGCVAIYGKPDTTGVFPIMIDATITLKYFFFTVNRDTVVQSGFITIDPKDCAGVCGGSAVTDDCGTCAGGNTGLIPNADKDCKGVCFGGATSEDCALRVRVKAFLSGPYDTSGLMNDDLRTKGYIPLNEPYSSIFTHYYPGGGEYINAGVLLTSGNDAIVDWVFLELRDKEDSTQVIATRSALIQRDGDVVDLDGTSPVIFVDRPNDDYFIAIRHRNHLGVMTGNAIFLDTTETIVDFTDAGTLTFGTNTQWVNGNKSMLWSGNIIPDEVMKFSGLNNDRDRILAKIGGLIPTNTVLGYNAEDVNMDGVVKYSGMHNDSDPILVNIGGLIPTNVLVQQLP